ncbi:MAG: hypothetical protein WCH46_03030 [bacterium]
MKKTIFALAICSLLLSCKTEPSAPTTDGSTLVVPKDTIFLSRADSSQALDLKLSCGCGFSLQVTSMVGDTDMIRYSSSIPMDSVNSTHPLNFWFQPSLPITWVKQSVTLNFLAHKRSYSYTNKVTVQIVP